MENTQKYDLASRRVLSFVAWFMLLAPPSAAGSSAHPSPATKDNHTTAGSHSSSPAPHWTYEGADGPANWSQLTADFASCSAGKNQSPINIAATMPAQLDVPEIAYQGTPLALEHNGHTVKFDYQPGSEIIVGGKRYQLLQFHFHTPSENQINGRTFPLEAHFVHAAADGRLAVVAILFEEGANNRSLQPVLANLPQHEGETTNNSTQFNAAGLLPPTASRKYYFFAGSLTTPPCSEGVNWFVMQDVQSASTQQIELLHAAMGDNARPVQPLNARAVHVSIH